MEIEDNMDTQALRETMVAEQIEARGVHDVRVLKAMRSVPRHIFVPEVDPRTAYADHPLSIGYGQTISQPYMVAYMCEIAHLGKNDCVLEVGTGSGYGAAVLSRLVRHVYTIDIEPVLAKLAEQTLQSIAYDNISVRNGDGCDGWRDASPFDAIIVTAATAKIPPSFIEQLKDGGRLVIPIGRQFLTQHLMLLEKYSGGITQQDMMLVRFVPLHHHNNNESIYE